MSAPRPLPGRLWLVRHGATAWSASGQHTGRTDVPLTPAGERDAAALAGPLGAHEFALVLTSPLRRAAATARLAGFGARAEPTDALLEWDYGAYEGLTTAAIRERAPGWTIWTGGVPGGETAEAVGRRAAAVLARAARAEGDVLLFAHGHVLRVLTAVYLGLAPTAGALFALATGTVSVLDREHERPVIGRWNLPPDAIPAPVR
jgi:broad specificity phosphatase PhoE